MGPYSKPNHGCKAEDSDAAAAYVQAILSYVTDNQRYADNAIAILNAYGHDLKGYTNANAPLQAAWGASKWLRPPKLSAIPRQDGSPKILGLLSHACSSAA